VPEVRHAALPALFISDLHLSAEHADTVAAFLAFLQGPAREAGSLFILGDLFEYWAGDDDIDAPFNRDMCAALKALSATGVELFYMTGNRDLLAGDDFARTTGMRLLHDPSLLVLGEQRILLSHGDALCTDDHAYQAYRQQVRDPAWQAGFLSQPLAARKAFIESLRKQSETAKQEKALTIMDVNTAAVDALLRGNGLPVLIHGHTHRPARHLHQVDGHECVRWVLSDWHGHATWLSFDGTRFNAGESTPA
jgi:UDP-2,3-diacylglucosamine hydrolase